MSFNNSANFRLKNFEGSGSAVIVNDSPSIHTPTVTGVISGANASAGDVGEFVSSVIPFASAISLTSAVAVDVTSIPLTAGDWDIWGNIYIDASAAITPDLFAIWTSTTSATEPDFSIKDKWNPLSSRPDFSIFSQNSVYLNLNSSSSNMVYLSVNVEFFGGFVTACGGVYARRRR